MDEVLFPQLVRQLYAVTGQLGAMFPGRHFTPDGHLVGSLGEAIAGYYYGVVLNKASTAGYDGYCGSVRVEVKATQVDAVPLSCCPPHLLVFKLRPDGSFEEHYNGPGALAWALLANRKASNQRQQRIGLSALRRVLREQVNADDQLRPVRPLPPTFWRAPCRDE